MNIANEQIQSVMKQSGLTAVEAVTAIIMMDVQKRRAQGETIDVKKLRIKGILPQQSKESTL